MVEDVEESSSDATEDDDDVPCLSRWKRECVSKAACLETLLMARG